MKKKFNPITLALSILVNLVWWNVSFASENNVIGNWFASCDPSSGIQQSGTYIYNEDGTFSSMEHVFRDNQCQNLIAIVTMKGTYELNQNSIIHTFDKEFTVTPITHEHAEALNAGRVCGITTWAALETPRTWESSLCQNPFSEPLITIFEITDEENDSFMILSLESADGSIQTVKRRKLAAGQ